MKKASFSLSGANEIKKILEQMPGKIKKKALKNAFREGAKIVKKQAQYKANSLGLDKEYVKSITVAAPKGKQKLNKNTVVVMAVKKPHSRIAHLLEFGTTERFKDNGASTGKIVAKPHLRPALDEKGNEAINEIAQILRQNIELTIRQMSAGNKVKFTKKARKELG